MTTLKELRHQLGTLHDKMTAMIKKADDESRQMTKEEEEIWNRMDADFSALRKDVVRREECERRQAELDGRVVEPPPEVRKTNHQEEVRTSEEQRKLEDRAFEGWIRFGFEGLNPEERAVMSRRKVTSTDGVPNEVRAQTVTTSGGGYLIPQGFSQQLEVALKNYGAMRTVARIMPTPTGAKFEYPTVDDTSQVGEIIAINSTHNAQDLTFGNVEFTSYKYSSKYVLVPVELLQDSFFDVSQMLADLLATRIGRITNTHFTTGDDSGKPKGVTAESTVGKTGTSGQTTSIIYADVVDLEHSLSSVYRRNARWMFADSTLKALKKLVDGSSRPLWQPALNGIAGSWPDTLMGYPYVINDDVAAMSASAKSIIFGDFSKYVIRDARDVQLVRMDERFAEFGQVCFLSFSRHDGRSIQAAAGLCFKHYANSAT